jgi:hypothetical protein
MEELQDELLDDEFYYEQFKRKIKSTFTQEELDDMWVEQNLS